MHTVGSQVSFDDSRRPRLLNGRGYTFFLPIRITFSTVKRSLISRSVRFGKSMMTLRIDVKASIENKQEKSYSK
jgi:hypothetical protein